MNSTRLLKLDATPETNTSSQTLQNKFAPGKKYEPIEFNQDSQHIFAGMRSPEELTSIAMLGHTGEKGIGDYKDAKELVHRFDAEFTNQFHGKDDKLKVRHVYIIGCEAGLKDKKEHSLAQTVADRLHKKGFRNVVVHAVSQPQHASTKFVGMRVMVTNGELGRIVGENPGHIKAMLLTKACDDYLLKLDKLIEVTSKDFFRRGKSAKESKELQSKLTGLLQQRKDYIRDQIAAGEIEIFFSTNNIQRTLDKRKHTFVPAESHIDNYIPPATSAVLSKLNKRLDELKDKDAEEKRKKKKGAEHQPDPYIAIVSDLITAIKKTDNVLECVNRAIDTIKRTISFVRNKVSTTFKLLNDIQEDELKVAQEDQKIEEVRAAQTAAQMRVVQPQPEQASKEEEEQPLRGKHEKDQAKNKIQHGKASPQMLDVIRKSLDAMTQYADELTKAYKASCFLAKHTWDNIKLYKAKTLNDFVTGFEAQFKANPQEAQSKWSEMIDLLIQDKKLIQGTFSHNVRNLLINIRKGQPKQYINDPENYIDEENTPLLRDTISRAVY